MLWEKLEALQQALLRAVDEHERLCLAFEPDRDALSASRWRVAQTGRARMAFLSDTIFAAAEQASAGSERQRIEALRNATPSYQRWISAYVARWPTDAILSDWGLYQREAKAFRESIRARVQKEVELLRPALRRVH